MNQKRVSLIWALTPIIILIFLLGTNVYLYGDDSLGGANQLALLFAGTIACIIGTKNGYSWKKIINSTREGH